jgi:hypothetical protein
MLPATIAYLRPLWVRKKYPHLPITTPWLDWPEDLRSTYDLDSIPQDVAWKGWGLAEPLDERAVVPAGDRLGRFVQPIVAPIAAVAASAPPAPGVSDEDPRPVMYQPAAAPTVSPAQASAPVSERPTDADRDDDQVEPDINDASGPRDGDAFAEIENDETA